jgi:hypothetical protein
MRARIADARRRSGVLRFLQIAIGGRVRRLELQQNEQMGSFRNRISSLTERPIRESYDRPFVKRAHFEFAGSRPRVPGLVGAAVMTT